LTQTGHRPLPEPVAATDPTIGEPPADLSGLGLELWHEYVRDRTALGTITRLDRITLILACQAVSRAEHSASIKAIDIARRLLTELLATPATRLKLGSLAKSKPRETGPQTTTAIGRSLDLIVGKRTG
jgi:hypothetical protein